MTSESSTAWKAYVLLLGIVTCVGCRSDVVYTRSIDPMITNGYVTDEVRMAVVPQDTLRVPAGTVVERSEGNDQVVIKQRKELAIFDHPAERDSIDDVRYKMGTIACRDGQTLELDTYGAYKIDGVGGRSISLTCIVPTEMNVEFYEQTKRRKADGLSPSALDRGLNIVEDNETWVILQNHK